MLRMSFISISFTNFKGKNIVTKLDNHKEKNFIISTVIVVQLHAAVTAGASLVHQSLRITVTGRGRESHRNVQKPRA